MLLRWLHSNQALRESFVRDWVYLGNLGYDGVKYKGSCALRPILKFKPPENRNFGEMAHMLLVEASRATFILAPIVILVSLISGFFAQDILRNLSLVIIVLIVGYVSFVINHILAFHRPATAKYYLEAVLSVRTNYKPDDGKSESINTMIGLFATSGLVFATTDFVPMTIVYEYFKFSLENGGSIFDGVKYTLSDRRILKNIVSLIFLALAFRYLIIYFLVISKPHLRDAIIKRNLDKMYSPRRR